MSRTDRFDTILELPCCHIQRLTSIYQTGELHHVVYIFAASEQYIVKCIRRMERLPLSNGSSDTPNEPEYILCVRIHALDLSQLTLFTNTRASACKPAKAANIFSSNWNIFRIVLGSCNFAVSLRSTARITESFPLTPTTTEPYCSARRKRVINLIECRYLVTFFTASIAYSTWNKCPSGEKTVIARSYLTESND